ncbi:hypothetical protein AALP_AAs70549U000100, partial [Arabis alpina]
SSDEEESPPSDDELSVSKPYGIPIHLRTRFKYNLEQAKQATPQRICNHRSS